jgi:hypothetical protein
MSADRCIVIIGIRLELPEEDVEHHAALAIARSRAVGLQHYWSRFGGDGGKYFIYTGAILGHLGSTNDEIVMKSYSELTQIMGSTQATLRSSGFHETPALFAHWEQDN